MIEPGPDRVQDHRPMFKNDPEQPDERGQVGIGTLIVFIAMVLVAAIAAGVLINTAGLLQSKSQQTGQQATNQVTQNLNIDNKIGQVNTNTHNSLNATNLTVQLSPGANAINLTKLSIQYTAPSGSGQLTYNSGGGSKHFTVSKVLDNDNSISNKEILNSPTDRASINVYTNGQNTGLALKPGQSATLTITTRSGASKKIVLSAPSSYSGKSSVQL